MRMLEKLTTKPTDVCWSVLETVKLQNSEVAKFLDDQAWDASRPRLEAFMLSDSITDCLNAIRRYRGFGAYFHMKAIHNPAETGALAIRVKDLAPKVIVEIGTCGGGSLFVWTRSNPQAELIVSMDLPRGLYGGGYYAARERMYRHFVYDRPQTRMELLRCDTHLPKSFQMLSEILQGRPIDFLFIDGDHTYEGVSADFQMYSPLVRPGGIVAFHDINTMTEDHHVHRHWNDIKAEYENDEIIEDPSSGLFGIGVLTMPQTRDRQVSAGS